MVVSPNFFAGLGVVMITALVLYFMSGAIAPLTGGGVFELVVRNAHILFILFALITIPVWAR